MTKLLSILSFIPHYIYMNKAVFSVMFKYCGRLKVDQNPLTNMHNNGILQYLSNDMQYFPYDTVIHDEEQLFASEM